MGPQPSTRPEQVPVVNSRVNVLFPYMRLWGQDVAVDLYSSCGGITKLFLLLRLTCYMPTFC